MRDSITKDELEFQQDFGHQNTQFIGQFDEEDSSLYAQSYDVIFKEMIDEYGFRIVKRIDHHIEKFGKNHLIHKIVKIFKEMFEAEYTMFPEENERRAVYERAKGDCEKFVKVMAQTIL